MEKTSVLAITKNGVNIGENLKKLFPDWNVFAPSKLTTEATRELHGILSLQQRKLLNFLKIIMH